MDAGITNVVVARGRSIQVGNRLYGPGETAPVPTAEVEHIRAHGFIHDPDGVVVMRTPMRDANNPSSVGLQQTTEY